MAGLDAFKAKFDASDTLPNVASSKEPVSVRFKKYKLSVSVN